MKLFSIYFYLVLVLISGCTPKQKSSNEFNKNIIISYNKLEKKIFSDPKNSLWTTHQFKDPNSEKLLSYSGYPLFQLIESFKEDLKFNELNAIKFVALDGYITTVDYEIIKSNQALLALVVSGQEKAGIYNKSLKLFFDWKPSYVIFFNNISKQTSPYQVIRIELTDKPIKNKILDSATQSLKPGAQIFIKTCNKCHSYLDEGGLKAPLISVLTKKWKTDIDLEKFLRNPQKTLGKKIEMPAFYGSQEELKNLILFLRSIEIKD